MKHLTITLLALFISMATIAEPMTFLEVEDDSYLIVSEETNEIYMVDLSNQKWLDDVGSPCDGHIIASNDFSLFFQRHEEVAMIRELRNSGGICQGHVYEADLICRCSNEDMGVGN